MLESVLVALFDMSAAIFLKSSTSLSLLVKELIGANGTWSVEAGPTSLTTPGSGYRVKMSSVSSFACVTYRPVKVPSVSTSWFLIAWSIK